MTVMPFRERKRPSHSTAVAPCVLTIAGSDSGAGAGIQADSRTIHALGGFALTAITAVTAQNSQEVSCWEPVGPSLIAEQIHAVFRDFSVAAVKTGLLPGAAGVHAVAEALKAHRRLPLVVDPVMGSTSGTAFLPQDGLRVLLTELFPLALLVTPNWPEAAALSGVEIRHWSDAESAARVIVERSRCGAVLVKGGHAEGALCRDILVLRSGRAYSFDRQRIETKNTHGTGCVLSAAIATRLALGGDLVTSVQDSAEFLHQALEAGRTLTLGKGRGPAFSGLV